MHDTFMQQQIVRSYDREMRERPCVAPGQRIDRVDGLVRTLGRHNTIVFAQVEAGDVERVIAKRVAYFRDVGEDVEWKLYAHDEPPNLDSSLASHGFEAGELETLLVLP